MDEGWEHERLHRFLLALARGGTLQEAASEAGLSMPQAEVILSMLVSQGYVERLNGPTRNSCPCTRCPLRALCGGRRKAGVYALTEKGRELLRALSRARHH